MDTMGSSGPLHATSAFVDRRCHLLVGFHVDVKSQSLMSCIAVRLSMLARLTISKGGTHPPDNVAPCTEFGTMIATLQGADGVGHRELMDQ